MTGTTIRQPATAGVPSSTRPLRLAALGKLVVLVLAVGTVVALVVAAGIGVVALLMSSATG